MSGQPGARRFNAFLNRRALRSVAQRGASRVLQSRAPARIESGSLEHQRLGDGHALALAA
jgi:hypothetical protein